MVRTLAARGGAEAAVKNTGGHEMYPEKACMRYGFVIPKGDPRTVAALARELEDAGWDGAFYWDGISLGGEWAGDVYDPWVVMAAMAMRTERVRLGAIVTPPSRRRPWKLARETMTLDRLSAGRLIVPVGLGAIDDDVEGTWLRAVLSDVGGNFRVALRRTLALLPVRPDNVRQDAVIAEGARHRLLPWPGGHHPERRARPLHRGR